MLHEFQRNHSRRRRIADGRLHGPRILLRIGCRNRRGAAGRHGRRRRRERIHGLHRRVLPCLHHRVRGFRQSRQFVEQSSEAVVIPRVHEVGELEFARHRLDVARLLQQGRQLPVSSLTLPLRPGLTGCYLWVRWVGGERHRRECRCQSVESRAQRASFDHQPIGVNRIGVGDGCGAIGQRDVKGLPLARQRVADQRRRRCTDVITSIRSMFPVIDTGILLVLIQEPRPVRSIRGLLYP